MKVRDTAFIIHLFALLHAVAGVTCRLAGIADEYLLTLLTIIMLVLVCLSREMRMEITSCIIALGNLAGYLIGGGTASVIGLLKLPDLATYPISTFLTTEILGFLVYWVTNLFSNSGKEQDRHLVRWLILTCATVYCTRVVLAVLNSRGMFSNVHVSERYNYFLISFCTMTLLVVIVLIGYAISERRRISQEQEKRHLAQFRYMKLNQQVNPHFLFNSLNVLDCLVTDGENEKASTYIHKLSNLYRYMLSNEDEVLVKLREEMEFVDQYVDLMQIRFQQGLIVETDIPEDLLGRSIVPCSVQLLLENATKHNSINKDKPLTIRIYASQDGNLTVSNNLCPKLTPVSSTGKGLKYIRQQFKDISGKDISIEKSDSTYSVTLPLL